MLPTPAVTPPTPRVSLPSSVSIDKLAAYVVVVCHSSGEGRLPHSTHGVRAVERKWISRWLAATKGAEGHGHARKKRALRAAPGFQPHHIP